MNSVSERHAFISISPVLVAYPPTVAFQGRVPYTVSFIDTFMKLVHTLVLPRGVGRDTPPSVGSRGIGLPALPRGSSPLFLP